ncbi:MAG: hypothetical protein ICV71_08595, partial [Thermoleophilia bacterium]|nr:hypothetical protein [Thermoleophilia bacterium]
MLRRLSRRGFIAGAASLAAVPLARGGTGAGSHAGVMERDVHADAATAGMGERVLAATEAELGLLVPPRPERARPGRVRAWEVVARDRR